MPAQLVERVGGSHPGISVPGVGRAHAGPVGLHADFRWSVFHGFRGVPVTRFARCRALVGRRFVLSLFLAGLVVASGRTSGSIKWLGAPSSLSLSRRFARSAVGASCCLGFAGDFEWVFELPGEPAFVDLPRSSGIWLLTAASWRSSSARRLRSTASLSRLLASARLAVCGVTCLFGGLSVG